MDELSKDIDSNDCGVEKTGVATPSVRKGGRKKGQLPKTGGRQAGTPNKRTDLERSLKRFGFDAGKELFTLLTSPDISPDKKLDAVVKIAPYIWTKRAETVSIDSNQTQTLTISIQSNLHQLTDARRDELERSLGIVVDGEATPVDLPTALIGRSPIDDDE